MPEIICEKLPAIPVIGDDGITRYILRVRWAGVALGDTCQEFEGAGAYPDKTVQVEGTFGGATVTMQGRNQAAGAQQTMTKLPSGDDAVFAAAGGSVLAENYCNLTPLLTGGDGTTSLDITITL